MGRAWCGEMPSLSRYGDTDQGCASCSALYTVVTFGAPAMFCGGACRTLFLFLCQKLSHSMWDQPLCPDGLWGILSCPSSLLSWTSADMLNVPSSCAGID